MCKSSAKVSPTLTILRNRPLMSRSIHVPVAAVVVHKISLTVGHRCQYNHILQTLILNYYKFYGIVIYDKPTILQIVVDKHKSHFGDGCQQVATYIYTHHTSMCIHTYKNKFPTRNRTYRHLVQLQQQIGKETVCRRGCRERPYNFPRIEHQR